MFEKATKTVKEVGGNVIDSAKNLGSTIYNVSKEQGEIAGLKVQKTFVEKKLQDYYTAIGKRYFEYISNSNGESFFDVSDILELMQPEIDKMKEIETTLMEKELDEKKHEEEKRQKKALDEFESDKARLDKALELDIISKEEYDEKMVVVRRRYDNYEQLRKIEMQLKMGIIDEEEYEAKVNRVLCS